MRSTIWILPLVSGCVLSVEARTSFPDDIHTIVVDVSKGDVRVEAQPGDITLDVDFGGLGSGDVGHDVSDGVLTVDYDCGGPELCGGDLVLTAPGNTALEISLGAGDVQLSAMKGDVLAELGAGTVTLEEHGAGLVVIDAGAGDVQAGFERRPVGVEATVGTGTIALQVPEGAYALELDAGTGTIDVSGITEDPSSEVLLQAVVTTSGTIEVAGRP